MEEMDVEEISTGVESVLQELPEREREIDELVTLFGRPQHFTPSLYVYGDVSTGKSTTVRMLMQKLELPHVLVNCFECSTLRLLYELTLSELSGEKPSAENNYTLWSRCDSLSEFLRLIPQAMDHRWSKLDSSEDTRSSTVYLVFDQAEQLRRLSGVATVLATLMRIQELTKRNVCAILVGSIAWSKLDSMALEPYTLHFPQYTTRQLQSIVARDCPTDVPSDIFNKYANIMIKCLQNPCRDLSELRHAAALLWPYYYRPVTEGKIDPSTATEAEKASIYRSFEPHLKTQLNRLYLRQTSTSEWGLQSEGKKYVSHRGFDLPFNSKHLLLAAYVASFNPKSTDKQIFVTNRTKAKRRRVTKAGAKKADKLSQHQIGPKAFAHDRMLAIYFAMNLDCKGVVSPQLLSQIKSLLSLGLIVQTNTDLIGAPQYLCMVSRDDAFAIGKSVGVDLRQFLADALTH